MQAAGFPGVRCLEQSTQADADAPRQAAEPPGPVALPLDRPRRSSTSNGPVRRRQVHAGTAKGAGAKPSGLPASAGRRPDFAIVTGAQHRAPDRAPWPSSAPPVPDDRLTGRLCRRSRRRAAQPAPPGPGAGSRHLQGRVAGRPGPNLRRHGDGRGRRRRARQGPAPVDRQHHQPRQPAGRGLGHVARSPPAAARRPWKLFRTLLVASSSVPGIFPPKLVEVETDDHVSSGDADKRRRRRRRAAVPGARRPAGITGGNPGSPLPARPGARDRQHGAGSLDPVDPAGGGLGSWPAASGRHCCGSPHRQALSLAAGFCSRHNLPLSVASIPNSFEGMNLLTVRDRPDAPHLRRRGRASDAGHGLDQRRRGAEPVARPVQEAGPARLDRHGRGHPRRARPRRHRGSRWSRAGAPESANVVQPRFTRLPLQAPTTQGELWNAQPIDAEPRWSGRRSPSAR
ncbi:hypothetical protein ACRAWD_24180 [Caulobacter segnis]